MATIVLNDLNDYVLTLIFDHCTIDDVLRLCHVCRRFQAIIIRYTFQRKSADLLLVGHRNREAIAYQRYVAFIVKMLDERLKLMFFLD